MQRCRSNRRAIDLAPGQCLNGPSIFAQASDFFEHLLNFLEEHPLQSEGVAQRTRALAYGSVLGPVGHRMKAFLLTICCAAQLFFSAIAYAQPVVMQMSLVPSNPMGTGNTGGASGGPSMSVQLVNITANAPFSTPTTLNNVIVRLTLPVGFDYASDNSTDWSCTGGTGALRELVCSKQSPFTTALFSTSFTLYFAIASNFPVGTLTLTATVEATNSNGTISFPVPTPLSCPLGVNSSTTQCLSDTVQIVQSALRIDSISNRNGAPLTVGGSSEFIEVLITNVGNSAANMPWRITMYWPPGLSFASVTGTPAWLNCSNAGNATSCTSTQNFVGQVATIFAVNVTAAALPGPVQVIGAIGNSNSLPKPTDCPTNLAQPGCGAGNLVTEAAPSARLVINAMLHLPATMTIGNNAGTITTVYQNVGTQAAATPSIALQLPPGFAFTGFSAGTGFAMSGCTASGTAMLGQVVVCTRPAGVPINGSGSVLVDVTILPGFISRLNPSARVVAASANVAAPDPQQLLSCASTPQLEECELRDIPITGACMTFADDIFCNGYENPL